MDANFARCLLFTLDEEGGFSDDPRDPGGATFKGITLAEYREFERNPNLTVADLKNMTVGKTEEIYRKKYWLLVSADKLPNGIDCSVFDAGVNTGVGRSIRQLQLAVGTGEDGKIGPRTLAAVAAMQPELLLMRLEQIQKAYYRSLRGFPDFGNGWLNRCFARYNHAMAMLSSRNSVRAR